MDSKKSCKVVQGCAGVRDLGVGGSLKTNYPEGPEGQPDALGHSPRAQGGTVADFNDVLMVF